MYRIVTRFGENIWFVAEGNRPTRYIMSIDPCVALTYVNMSDAMSVKFLAQQFISQDIRLILQHSIDTNDGVKWENTVHVIPPDFLDDLITL